MAQCKTLSFSKNNLRKEIGEILVLPSLGRNFMILILFRQRDLGVFPKRDLGVFPDALGSHGNASDVTL